MAQNASSRKLIDLLKCQKISKTTMLKFTGNFIRRQHNRDNAFEACPYQEDFYFDAELSIPMHMLYVNLQVIQHSGFSVSEDYKYPFSYPVQKHVRITATCKHKKKIL